MKSTATKTVAASAAAVWAVLADHEGMSAWAPGLTATLAKAGSTDRNGLGAVRRITNPLPVPPIVEEVTAFEPNRRLAYRAISGVPLKSYRGEVLLEPTNTGTKITYSISADRRL